MINIVGAMMGKVGHMPEHIGNVIKEMEILINMSK